MTDGAERGAIILAGGDGKRLGRPKPTLPLGGVTLIERIIDRLKPFFDVMTIITDRPELFKGLSVKLSGDLLTEYQKSPLRGIHAGLKGSHLPYQFVVACDMPFVNLELISHMFAYAANYDIVVPFLDNYYQPLHAFYSRSCVPVIAKKLAAGRFKVTDFYSGLNVKKVGFEEMAIDEHIFRGSFFNINTWEDYEKAENLLVGTGGERNV